MPSALSQARLFSTRCELPFYAESLQDSKKPHCLVCDTSLLQLICKRLLEDYFGFVGSQKSALPADNAYRRAEGESEDNGSTFCCVVDNSSHLWYAGKQLKPRG